MDRLKFAMQATDWLGVPYQHRGTTRGGCDCTGLLIGVARELGFLKNYQIRKYPVDWNLHSMADDYIAGELNRLTVEIPKNQADTGDIIIMHFGRCISHCGILVDREKMLMVHSYRTSNKVTKGLLRNSKYARHWVRTFRIDAEKISTFS